MADKQYLPGLDTHLSLNTLDKSGGNPWQKNTLYRNGRHVVRQGFGLLADYSTPFSAYRPDDSTTGYTEILGVHARVTDQGHHQITSLVKLQAYTASTADDDAGVWVAGSTGQSLSLLAVVIHDVTSDATVEFVLERPTVESCTSTTRLPNVLPAGQTQPGRDLTSFIVCQDTPAVSWATILDELYVCVSGYGVWRVGSIDISTSLNRQLEAMPGHLAGSYGETGAVTRLVPQQGFYSDGVQYLTASQFGSPQAITAYENRLVYAINRTLLFSDPDFPQHIMAGNQQTIPSERPITAIAAVKGQILAWSESETWLYQPQTDLLVSGGRTYNLSRTIGCLSPSHVAASHEQALWVDRWGVHGNTGGTSVEPLSEKIDPWFTEGDVQDPVSSHVWLVNTSLTTDQPRARFSLANEIPQAQAAWDDRTSTLYLTMPSITLAWQQGNGWTTLGFNTLAGTVVQSRSALDAPKLAALEGSLYAVALRNTPYSDATSGDQFTLGSLSFYAQGRGGALDRTSSETENRRTPVGEWVVSAPTASLTPAMRIGKPIHLPAGYETSIQTTSQDTWLLPLEISADPVDNWRCHFTIDSHWRVLLSGTGAGRVDFIVPNDRVTSQTGYTTGLGEVRAYNGGGVPDNNGLNIRVYWDGTAPAPGLWSIQPNMNLLAGQYKTVLYIPVQRLTGSSSGDTVFDTVTSITFADLDPAGVNTPCQASWWRSGSYPAQSLDSDSEALPVDWALKTKLVTGKNQLLCRGSYTKLQSNGSATVKPTSATDVLNVLTTSDYTDYSGQASWASTNAMDSITDRVSMRARLLSSTSIPALKVGGSVATWGSTTNNAQGNLLIDDPAVDTIAVSEGVQGEQFSTLLYGSLANPAEALSIQSVDLEVRVTGQRRRGGR